MYTWKLQLFRVRDLKDYHKNPRRLSRMQSEQLMESIRKFGLIDKPVVTQEGVIIGGHARKKILEKLEIKEVECYVPSQELSEKEIEELNIRLNKNGGEFDFDILANHFDAVELVNWGFIPEELGVFYEQESEGEDTPDKCGECGRTLKGNRGKGQRRKTSNSS